MCQAYYGITLNDWTPIFEWKGMWVFIWFALLVLHLLFIRFTTLDLCCIGESSLMTHQQDQYQTSLI